MGQISDIPRFGRRARNNREQAKFSNGSSGKLRSLSILPHCNPQRRHRATGTYDAFRLLIVSCGSEFCHTADMYPSTCVISRNSSHGFNVISRLKLHTMFAIACFVHRNPTHPLRCRFSALLQCVTGLFYRISAWKQKKVLTCFIFLFTHIRNVRIQWGFHAQQKQLSLSSRSTEAAFVIYPAQLKQHSFVRPMDAESQVY